MSAGVTGNHVEQCRACRELEAAWSELTAGMARQGRLPVADPRRWKDARDRQRYAKAAAIRKAQKERRERLRELEEGMSRELM